MVIRFVTIRIANIIQIMLNLDMYVWIMRAKTMSVTDDILKTDYSLQFDEKRKALVVQSHYKYGRAGRNFATGNVDAIGSLEKCLAKFKETGNTDIFLMLPIMLCSDICGHKAENTLSIPTVMNQPE